MGGALKRIRATLVWLVIAICALVFPIRTEPVYAAATLQQARDIVGSVFPGTNGVIHSIYFVIPPSSSQIYPSDYILVDLPNYLNVTGNVSVVGGYGEPTFTVIGTQVKITNVIALAGTGLSIDGIVATNPLETQSNEVRVRIANDSNATIVRDEVIVFPSTSDSTASVTATIESPVSGIRLTGFTSPDAFVSITEEGAVIGTTLADGSGFFSFSMTGVNPGNHTYNIGATDRESRATARTVINLFALANTLTTASGILLSPTISLNKSEILPGESIIISGEAKPLSQINIFVESPLRSYTANSDALGEWSYTVSTTDTNSYAPGQYRTYTVVQDDQGGQSPVSLSLNFTVGTPDSDNPEPACDISRGDLNCDGKTNLRDFSILLFHWRTNHKLADINRDGTVNLKDFSVMMFYYGK